MTRKPISVSILLLAGAALILLAACGGGPDQGAGARTGRIRPTWIDSQSGGDTMAIAAGDVQKNIMTHFRVPTGSGNMTFMAYTFDGKTHVRADICPPCRSQSYSLEGDRLVCDACGTLFEARTGAGISGACVAYPKESVNYAVREGNLLMKRADLVNAYQSTQRPKAR